MSPLDSADALMPSRPASVLGLTSTWRLLLSEILPQNFLPWALDHLSALTPADVPVSFLVQWVGKSLLDVSPSPKLRLPASGCPARILHLSPALLLEVMALILSPSPYTGTPFSLS